MSGSVPQCTQWPQYLECQQFLLYSALSAKSAVFGSVRQCPAVSGSVRTGRSTLSVCWQYPSVRSIRSVRRIRLCPQCRQCPSLSAVFGTGRSLRSVPSVPVPRVACRCGSGCVEEACTGRSAGRERNEAGRRNSL